MQLKNKFRENILFHVNAVPMIVHCHSVKYEMFTKIYLHNLFDYSYNVITLHNFIFEFSCTSKLRAHLQSVAFKNLAPTNDSRNFEEVKIKKNV